MTSLTSPQKSTLRAPHHYHPLALIPLVTGLWCGTPSWAQTPEPTEQVSRQASALAQELATACPSADPGDQQAFDRCRTHLYQESKVRAALPDFVLWGRQRDPQMRLKDTKLTQFAPDVFAGMYLPLFMFNGKHTVEYVEREKLYLIRLQTAFRNRLPPGQFPYPFWHEAEKWKMYQGANELLLWWDPKKTRIKVAQFTVFGTAPPIAALSPMPAPRPFVEDEWMWTDEQGQTQPKVTVFDGLLSANNPYIGKLDSSYKRLALRIRDSKCFECHVPNNPDGMKHLVLLQTPAHAAGEIKRLLKSIRDDKMPVDSMGIEEPLDAKTKSALLSEGVIFDRLYDEAKQWEAQHPR